MLRSINVIYGVIKRTGQGLLSRISFLNSRLTSNEAEFIRINKLFWSKFAQLGFGNKYVLVNFEQYPLVMVGNTFISTFIAQENNARILVLAPSRRDKSVTKVLQSFPYTKVIFEDGIKYAIYRMCSLILALNALRKIKTSDQLISFSVDGIQFGDLIYDALLSQGYATCRSVRSFDLLKVMASFYYKRRVITAVLDKYNVIKGMTNHYIGIGGGVFMRYLISRNKEVWVRETTLKKYKSMQMIHECCMTPDKRYIEHMYQNRNIFVPLADKCLKERLGNKTCYSNLAYKSEKRLYSSKNEFAAAYGLNPKNKNVFIMMHAFNDYPHTYGELLFRDYYEWFEYIVSAAQKNKNVNWIFKNHPYAAYYPTKDIDLKEIFSKITQNENIKFFDKDENFNTASLQYICDAILTCIGTAGLEYSCFGVPCVLVGKCWYTGHGFTIEPATLEEYREIIDNIATLPRLSDEKIVKAKMLAYFTFEVVNLLKYADPYRTVAAYDIDETRKASRDQMFANILRFRQESSENDKEKYLQKLRAFICSDSLFQYVDFEKHNLFQDIK